MLVGEHALAQERRGDGQVQPLGEPDQRIGGAVSSDTRACQHHRVGRGSQDIGGAQHLALVGRGIDGGVHAQGLRVGLTLGDVLGKDQERCPGSLRGGLLERLAHHLRRRIPHRHHVAPLRDGTEQRHEVDELVGFLVDAVKPRLRRDRQHRVRVQLGVRDAQHQVDRAGSQRREAHAGLAGQRTVRVGHERRTAFVPRRDEPDRGVGERVHHVQVLFAGQPEDVLDTLVLEAFHDQARDGTRGRRAHPPRVSDREAGLGRRAFAQQLTCELRVPHVLTQMLEGVQERPRRRHGLVGVRRPPGRRPDPPRFERDIVRDECSAAGRIRIEARHEPVRHPPPPPANSASRSRSGSGAATARLSQDRVLPSACVARTARPIRVIARGSPVQLVGRAAVERLAELVEGVAEDVSRGRDRGVGHDQLISIIFSRTA